MDIFQAREGKLLCLVCEIEFQVESLGRHIETDTHKTKNRIYQEIQAQERLQYTDYQAIDEDLVQNDNLSDDTSSDVNAKEAMFMRWFPQQKSWQFKILISDTFASKNLAVTVGAARLLFSVKRVHEEIRCTLTVTCPLESWETRAKIIQVTKSGGQTIHRHGT